MAQSVEPAKRGFGIVVLQDLAVGVAFGGHNGGSYLSEANTMTPAGTFQDESVLSLFNDERTAEQMAL